MTALGRVVVTDAAVVVVPVEEPEASGEVVAALIAALVSSGADALCRLDPATDALVVVDGQGRIARHLDRAGHGVIGLPQVVARAWWDRLGEQVDALGAASAAAAVLAGGGRVAALPPALWVAPA